jgi:hypothetical protein
MNDRDTDIEMIRINTSISQERSGIRQERSGWAFTQYQMHLRKSPVGFGCELSGASMSNTTGHHAEAMMFRADVSVAGYNVAGNNQGSLTGNKPDTELAALDPGG